MKRSLGLLGLCCFFKAGQRLVAVCLFTENLRSNEKQLLSNLQTGERGRCSVRVRDLVVVWALIFAGTSCGVVAQDLVVDPSTLPPLASFKDCDACPEMVVMPPGSFMMGAIEGESRNPFDFSGENPTFERRPEGETNIITFEHPRHRVEMVALRHPRGPTTSTWRPGTGPWRSTLRSTT